MNNPDKTWHNFSYLTHDSPCDNYFLELRFAIELFNLGYLQSIFPLMIGDFDEEKNKYGNFFSASCLPKQMADKLEDAIVDSVETELVAFMAEQGLGSPITAQKNRSVFKTLSTILSCQGFIVEGSADCVWSLAVEQIAKLQTACD